MASLSNDLESLSLDLPDVVAEAAKSNKASRPTGARKSKRGRKTEKTLEESDRGLVVKVDEEDQRVPDLSLPLRQDVTQEEVAEAALGLDLELSKVRGN